jgi:hypothetical protein
MAMPVDSLQEQVGRDARGRFEKGRSGNPAGRRQGVRNRATILAEQLLAGHAAALIEKAVERALAGDALALKLCLDRIMAPIRESAVRVALPPLHSAADLAGVMGAVTAAAADGRITPGQGSQLAQMVETAMRAIESSDCEKRLQQVEKDLAERTAGDPWARRRPYG